MLVLADDFTFALVLLLHNFISGWNYTVAQTGYLGTTIKVSLWPLMQPFRSAVLIMIYYTFVQLLENICYGEEKDSSSGDERVGGQYVQQYNFIWEAFSCFLH